ncbi:hypothetical protein BGW36DRAFT_345612 [Talaromyces proteolyticus]|uniref:Transaldolase n=1 Tax=Talaromyces proteolyticus TaxID=1131652 RepID=A0AAD4KPH8_9EURO|nr:uncharacterized protein BGW36DRAFT_345612 [Talaromyces proteolyticus]KAH8693798.1 hypothetical protein BGW36DRAFT_345612 [Talaromyces proteolyticus]
MAATKVNLLDYLRSRTQIDFDSFDIEAAKDIEKFVDCTSNQFEYYAELEKPSRKELLGKSIQLAASIHEQFPTVTYEELVVEIGAIYLTMEIYPMASGDMHVMANPWYAYSKQKVVDTGKRLHRLCKEINPSFDPSRLVMKVPATWEGLQACRELRYSGIKTLATTLFTMEQAVLAGEVGCVSISPFVHELKALFDNTYKDGHPLLDLCVRAQQWYENQSLGTKVKACATMGLDELLQLAGVDALTIVPDDLRTLRSTHRPDEEVKALSLFTKKAAIKEKMEYPSYIDDQVKYRMDFDAAEGGNAQFKLGQAITIFCDFQKKAENLVKVAQAGCV